MTGHDLTAPAVPVRGVAPALGRALGLLALLLVAHLLEPAFTSTHVEGYTASLQLDAIAAQRGLIDRADLLYPVQTEYLYLTRQGVVLLLRALMQLSGGTGDALFRGLMLVSLAVFLATTALLARRHAPDLRRVPTLAALVLLPGLFELGFHFSDNLVAVAFGMGGLALLPRAAPRPGASWLLRAAAAGAALGMAVLCRADALLLLPLALGLAWLDQRRLPRLALLAAVGAAGMLAAFAVAQSVSGTTFLDALRIGRFFDMQHAGARIFFVRALVCLLFFGIPGLVFCAIGVLRGWRIDNGWRRVALLGLPVLALLYALRSATETRQIYPYIAPFAVIACARGVQWTLDALRTPQRRGALALLAGTAVVWLLPPVFVPVKDGPRAVVGRLWSPPMWRIWQGRVDASLDDVDALLAHAEALPRMALVSAHFNTDHYLQLRAWQRGWLPLRPAETAERCGGGVEVWKKGRHQLALVRLDNTYGLSGIDGNDFIAIHLREALRCPSLARPPAYVADFWPPLSTEATSEVLRERFPAASMAYRFGWPEPVAARIQGAWGWRDRVVPLSYGSSRTAPLDAGQLARAAQAAERWLAETTGRDDGRPLPGMDTLLPRFRTRYWHMPATEPHGALVPG